MKLDSKHDAASSYVEGAKALMKVSPGEAVPLLQQVRLEGPTWPFEPGSAAAKGRGTHKHTQTNTH